MHIKIINIFKNILDMVYIIVRCIKNDTENIIHYNLHKVENTFMNVLFYYKALYVLFKTTT